MGVLKFFIAGFLAFTLFLLGMAQVDSPGASGPTIGKLDAAPWPALFSYVAVACFAVGSALALTRLRLRLDGTGAIVAAGADALPRPADDDEPGLKRKTPGNGWMKCSASGVFILLAELLISYPLTVLLLLTGTRIVPSYQPGNISATVVVFTVAFGLVWAAVRMTEDAVRLSRESNGGYY